MTQRSVGRRTMQVVRQSRAKDRILLAHMVRLVYSLRGACIGDNPNGAAVKTGSLRRRRGTRSHGTRASGARNGS